MHLFDKCGQDATHARKYCAGRESALGINLPSKGVAFLRYLYSVQIFTLGGDPTRVAALQGRSYTRALDGDWTIRNCEGRGGA